MPTSMCPDPLGRMFRNAFLKTLGIKRYDPVYLLIPGCFPVCEDWRIDGNPVLRALADISNYNDRCATSQCEKCRTDGSVRGMTKEIHKDAAHVLNILVCQDPDELVVQEEANHPAHGDITVQNLHPHTLSHSYESFIQRINVDPSCHNIDRVTSECNVGGRPFPIPNVPTQ